MSDGQPFLNAVPGLKTDLELLLAKFSESNSVRYTEFSKLWRQMGFPSIFCGWATELCLREMVEAALHLAVGFWQDIYTFQVKMGGLYLMYAFYFAQPIEPRQKIRLTQSQWSQGRGLLETIQQQRHLDAEFIYHKLNYYKAFYYVVTPLPYNQFQNKRYKDEETKHEEQAPQIETSLGHVFPSALMDNIQSLHDQYHDLKSQVINNEKLSEVEGLFTLKEDFIDVLSNGIKHMDTWKPGMASYDPDIVTKPSLAPPTSPVRHGTVRRRLKEHAFERQGIISRHQRHLVAESSSEGTSDHEKEGLNSPKKSGRRKRQSSSSVTLDDVQNFSSMPLDLDFKAEDEIEEAPQPEIKAQASSPPLKQSASKGKRGRKR